VYDARVSTEVGADAWIRTRNLAADAAGSIHDDAEARRRGLPGGLVPGNVQLAIVQRVAAEALGAAWYERGSLRFAWRRPLYDGDEVCARVIECARVPGEERALEIALEKRDGSAAATARVVLAESVDRLRPPWQDEAPLPQGQAAPDPLPEEPLDFEHPPKGILLDPLEIEGALADLDPSPWYRGASPFGRPIVPVVAFLPFTGQGRRRPRAPDPGSRPRSRIRAGMNGALDLAMSGPLFVGERYERRMRTVDKGFARRTAFRTLEISLSDARGRRLWHARWRANWFPSEDGARA
jgi:hypothetical protein